MPLPEPTPGLVISYAYLWWDQARRGQEEGIKDRPCVVVLAVRQEEGERIVTVAPISHAPPRDLKDGVELPAETKRRLGLDDQRSWIITSELNRFAWPGPDLRPISQSRPGEFAYGGIPRKLMQRLIERISERHRERQLKTVRRDDGEGQTRQ